MLENLVGRNRDRNSDFGHDASQSTWMPGWCGSL